MEQQKPPPSVEVSLKYMAWDIKRGANALEAIQKLFENYVGGAVRNEPSSTTKHTYKAHHRDTEDVPF